MSQRDPTVLDRSQIEVQSSTWREIERWARAMRKSARDQLCRQGLDVEARGVEIGKVLTTGDLLTDKSPIATVGTDADDNYGLGFSQDE